MSDWNHPPTFRADLAQAKRNRDRRRALALGLTVLFALVLLGGGGAYVWFDWLKDTPAIPPTESLYSLGRAPGLRFIDRNGALLAERGPRLGQRVAAASLPPYVAQAFLAAEDRRFWRHGPLDAEGLIRAALADLRAGHVVQGGSTLTQQLAKGLFLTPDQTFRRKAQEAYLAFQLYDRLGRPAVLDLYLNRVFLGDGANGLDAGARTYFGHPASQLTLSEAALLAALPKAPTRLTPSSDPAAALARSRLVLANMRREGWITAGQEAAAIAHPPAISPAAEKSEGVFGYALDQAAAQTVRLAGEGGPDLVVRLSLDAGLQRAAAGALASTLAAQGKAARAHQGAVVLLDDDGAILAEVGGADYDASAFNRAVQARRQPGSAFKPFVYAAAVADGVAPTDLIDDAPIRIGDWAPRNYGGGYGGPTMVQDALAHSINTVAVRLAQREGADRIALLATGFGVGGLPPEPNLSIALGSYEVTLLDLTSAYQVFQQAGMRASPHLVESIDSLDGANLYTRAPVAPARVYDQTQAATMVRMMQRVITAGTGTRANPGRPAAGKTGTTQNWKDAWFVGFTPDFVAGVWIGNDDGAPMNKVTGGDLPAAVWREVMLAAEKDRPVREFDWLADSAPPPDAAGQAAADVAPDPRAGFYAGLQSDFEAAARGD